MGDVRTHVTYEKEYSTLGFNTVSGWYSILASKNFVTGSMNMLRFCFSSSVITGEVKEVKEVRKVEGDEAVYELKN